MKNEKKTKIGSEKKKSPKEFEKIANKVLIVVSVFIFIAIAIGFYFSVVESSKSNEVDNLLKSSPEAAKILEQLQKNLEETPAAQGQTAEVEEQTPADQNPATVKTDEPGKKAAVEQSPAAVKESETGKQIPAEKSSGEKKAAN